MIHFQGDRSFSLPVNALFTKLSDASFLVGCLKDVEEVSQASGDRASWKLKPGFSFIRGTLDITMDVVERTPDSAVKLKLVSRGIGATSTVQALLEFLKTETGASVHWSADITEMTGLLKLVPKGLISSTAGKVIEDTWNDIEKKLG